MEGREIKRRSSIFLLIGWLIFLSIPLVFFILPILSTKEEGDFWFTVLFVVVFVLIASLPLITIFCCKKILVGALNATPLPAIHAGTMDSRVEEISLASGIEPPELKYIEDKLSNVYSFRCRKRSMIFITEGLIESLKTDELRAVLAHEMARVRYGYDFKSKIRTTLRAIPTMLRVKLGKRIGSLVYAAIVIVIILILLLLLPWLAFLATEDGTGLIIYGFAVLIMPVVWYNLMNEDDPSIHAEFYGADDWAVKWTMHPEALVSAMRKIQPFETHKVLKFLPYLSFIPFGQDPSKIDKVPEIPQKRTTSEIVKFIWRNPAWRFPLFPSVEMRIQHLARSLNQPYSGRTGE
jgi:Zn-dependent protease with chaperone function